MTYEQFMNQYPLFDLFFELFKGIIPTIVAIVAIYYNNEGAIKRDKKARKEDIMIKIKETMLDKLITVTNMYYTCGKIAIECIAEQDENNKRKKNNELFDYLNILYAKSWEIVDYYNTMFVSLHIDINCKELNNNIYEFGRKITDIVSKSEDRKGVKTEKTREENIIRGREEISKVVSESTSWKAIIMKQISDSIRIQ